MVKRQKCAKRPMFLPIGAVARQLGFTEVTNFTKFFIRRVKMTPGAFRRSTGTLIGPPANITDGPGESLPTSCEVTGIQFAAEGRRP